jgi:hypothetical protein
MTLLKQWPSVIFATMTLDTTLAFDAIIRFVSMVALLTSPVMQNEEQLWSLCTTKSVPLQYFHFSSCDMWI